MSETVPPAPWHAFFLELDSALQNVARLDCIGGFVVTQLYGFSRPTADVDVIELAPREASVALMELGRPDREDLTMQLWMEMLEE